MAATAGKAFWPARAACSDGSSRPIITACFEARIDMGLSSQISLAQRVAAAINSPGATTSLTKPSSLPSAAETRRPVRIMPMARFRPI